MGESRVRDGDYINIQSFMVKDMGLSGNELLVYAIIHGFSKDGESRFTGSIGYLEDWTNASRRTIQNTLESLVEREFITKHIVVVNGVTFNQYSANVLECTPRAKIAPPCEEVAPNNIEYNQDNKENNIKDIAKETTKKPNKYFENDELEELFIDFLAMRTKKKVPNTERSIKMLLNKLNKYDDKTKVVAINESILHGWVSVFPESADRFNQQNIRGNERQTYVQPAQTPVQPDRTLDVKSYTRGEILSVLQQDDQYRKLLAEYSRQSMELAKAQLNNADGATLAMCEEKARKALETLNARIRELGFDPREVQ